MSELNCPGTGQRASNIRMTSMELGPRFGGKRVGKCSEQGCYVRVTDKDSARAHKADPGSFERYSK